MLTPRSLWLSGVLVGAGLPACRAPADPPVTPLAVATALEAVVPTLQDTPTRAATSSPPTPVNAILDSLRREISRLGSSIVLLQSAVAGQIRIRAGTDTSASDSTTAARTVAGVRHYGIRTAFAILVFLIAWAAVRGAVWLLGVLAERQTARRLFYLRFIPIVRIVVYVLAVYYIIAIVYDVDRNGLLAATAAVGVGVGFASQGVLKNFFGGLIIILDQPFQVGDKVDIGGTYGEVVNIGLRVTRIVTPDDSLVSVPNSAVVEGHVSNANSGALDCQVVVDLYLPGWVDPTVAKEIARSAAVMSKYCHLEKPVVVMVKDEFRETFLTHLKVKAYVLDTRYEFAFASDVTETAKGEFLRQGLIQPGLMTRAFLAMNGDLASQREEGGDAR